MYFSMYFWRNWLHVACFLFQQKIDTVCFIFNLPVLKLITWRTGSLVKLGHQGRIERGKVTLPPFPHSDYFFNDEIYLGYSAAIPGKLKDHLASWPLQRQP